MPGDGAVMKRSTKPPASQARKASHSRAIGAPSVWRTGPIACGAASRLTIGRENS